MADDELITISAKPAEDKAPRNIRQELINFYVDEAEEEEGVEPWEREGFKSKEDYEEYWALFVNDCYDQSYEKYSRFKKSWKLIDERLEMLGRLAKIGSRNTSNADLVLLPQAIEKAISIQLEGRPRPYFEPLQQTDEQFASGLNFYATQVLDEQKFDLKLAAALHSAKKFGVGCLKQTIIPDASEGRLFGQKAKIAINKVDMRHVWPDPFAESWETWRWLCVATPMDLDEAKRRYPDYAHKIVADSSSTGEANEDEALRIASISPSGKEFQPGVRRRVVVKELWLKDESLEFVVEKDDYGNIVYDSEGEPIGRWMPAFPGMRLIVAIGKQMVFNGPNPFKHGHAPYTFLADRVSDQLFPVADCELLLPLEDKINTQHKAGFKHTLSNANSPWVCDTTAFDSPDKLDQLTSEEGGIITKNHGTEVNRLDAKELPGSFFGFLSWIESKFNDLTGVSNINQGMLQKGAQLSADAIAQLQGASAANIKMKQNLLEQAEKEFGFQLQWNIRQACDDPVSVQLNDPASGDSINLAWNTGDDQPDYGVNIQVTSSLPANKAGIMSTGMQLYEKGAIDRQAFLDQIKYPGRGEVVKRMKQREDELVKQGKLQELLKKNPSLKQSL